jgi:FtsP/CotA-like multicopper oxidase with cupredoxin domain
VPRVGRDRSTPPAQLVLPARAPLGAASVVRQVSLNEVDSEELEDVGPRQALLGTVDLGGETPAGVTLRWDDAISENPAPGATEVWEIYNFTGDAHPIHIHEVQFEVLNREVFDPEVGTPGAVRPPEAWETGTKDTVIAYPGEITRVKALFDLPGLFVWHCHIVEHEDHEMMRPYSVGPPPTKI